MPEFTGREREYLLNTIDSYTECSVMQASCKAELIRRGSK